MTENLEGYAAVKVRLDQIVEAVSNEDLPLDEALALYEEAVKLGSQVSDLIEQDISLSKQSEADETEAEEIEAEASLDEGTDLQENESLAQKVEASEDAQEVTASEETMS